MWPKLFVGERFVYSWGWDLGFWLCLAWCRHVSYGPSCLFMYWRTHCPLTLAIYATSDPRSTRKVPIRKRWLLRQILCIKKNIGANLTNYSKSCTTCKNQCSTVFDLIGPPKMVDFLVWRVSLFVTTHNSIDLIVYWNFRRYNVLSGVNAVLARWIWLGVRSRPKKKEKNISNTKYVVAGKRKIKYNDIFLEFYVKNFYTSLSIYRDLHPTYSITRGGDMILG